MQILAGDVMLIIFASNWIESMLSSSKEENILVLKYEDPSLSLFLNPTYLTALLTGFKILAVFIRLWYYKKGLESLIFTQ